MNLLANPILTYFLNRECSLPLSSSLFKVLASYKLDLSVKERKNLDHATLIFVFFQDSHCTSNKRGTSINTTFSSCNNWCPPTPWSVWSYLHTFKGDQNMPPSNRHFGTGLFGAEDNWEKVATGRALCALTICLKARHKLPLPSCPLAFSHARPTLITRDREFRAKMPV